MGRLWSDLGPIKIAEMVDHEQYRIVAACDWFWPKPQKRGNFFFNVAKFASIWQNMDQGTFLPQTGEYWLTTTTATSNSAEFLQRLTCFATRRAFCDLAIFATLVETGVMTTEICFGPGTLLYFKTKLIWIYQQSALTISMKPSNWAIKIKSPSDFILPLSYICSTCSYKTF